MPRADASVRAAWSAGGALIAAAAAALALGGCPAAAQTCATDDECGDGGRCEPTGYCSVADETCGTGRRYADSAPSGQANACVDAFGTTTGAVPPPVEPDSGAQHSTSSGGMTDESTTATDECASLGVSPDLVDFGFVFPDWANQPGRIFVADIESGLNEGSIGNELELRISSASRGTFTLGQLDEASFATCQRCVIAIEDGERFFFAVEGEITIEEDAAPLSGELRATLSDIRFDEVDIDPQTGATVPVAGGRCLRIESVEVETIDIPGWRCPTGAYGDGFSCDCGCGMVDPDCPDMTVEACDTCDFPGSCSSLAEICEMAIDPVSNGQCDLSLWTCDVATYDAGDASCDCGCGLVDPDCESEALEACTVCSAAGSCAEGQPCAGYIDLYNNAGCGMIPGWTCDEGFYEGMDGCDCGCGLPDPDCEMPTLKLCEYCNNFGSCSDLDCVANPDLDPENPAQCLPG